MPFELQALAGEPSAVRRPRVLIVEDDHDFAGSIQRCVRAEGYDTRIASTGDDALASNRRFFADVILLDLGLPDRDGVDVARRLRSETDAPILIVSGRDALAFRVDGLDAGADDYLVKPFQSAELLARMRALLRRRPPRGSAALVVGDLWLNVDTREVRRGGRKVELTAREFELLEYLMRNRGLVLSRERLLEGVWRADPWSPKTNRIDVFICTLRAKLEAGGERRLLHTVRGAGYVVRG